MSILLSILFLVSFVALIIGIINPSLIMRWSKKPTRIKVIGLWWLLMIVLLIISAVSIPEPTSQELIDSAKKNIEKEDYVEALSDLKKIDETDSLYIDAKELIIKADSLLDLQKKEQAKKDSLLAIKERERLASLSEEEMTKKEKEQFAALQAALQKEKYNDSLKLLAQTERKKFDVKYDEFKEITWLYSKTRPAYDNTKAFYTYIGINKQGHAWCRLVIRYHGEDWLFVKSIIIKTDNNTYTLAADNVQRDHNTDVWEWIDINVGEGEDIILYDIIHSKQTKIRFVGYQYHYDWTLPAKTIKGLKEIYDYYYLLDSVSKIDD